MAALISVIIPVFNGEKYIEQCLDSVINQSYKNFELIVINDGSTDNTREILRKYKNRGIIIHQDNCGVSKALNKGISKASGDYVCFLSHDDMWTSDKLKIELEYILNADCGVVYSDFYKLFGDKAIELHVREYNNKILRKYCFLNISSCMIVKSNLDHLKEKNGYYFDETLKSAMDWDIWIRLSQICKFKHIPICLSYYRLHPEQTIRKNFHNEDMKGVYEKYNGKGLTGRIFLLIREYIHWLVIIYQNKKFNKTSKESREKI